MYTDHSIFYYKYRLELCEIVTVQRMFSAVRPRRAGPRARRGGGRVVVLKPYVIIKSAARHNKTETMHIIAMCARPHEGASVSAAEGT